LGRRQLLLLLQLGRRTVVADKVKLHDAVCEAGRQAHALRERNKKYEKL
jgi:hypothetical protein